MSFFQQLEQRLAGLVEGTFGRVFRGSVQPVELARRLVKEMDEGVTSTMRESWAPNVFDVYLSREDHQQLGAHAGALTSELAEYLAEHARRNGYALLARPRVSIKLDRDLKLGEFGIAAHAAEPDEVAKALAAAEESEPATPEQTMVTPMPGPAAAMAAAGDGQVAPPLALVGPEGRTVLRGARVSAGRGSSNDLVLGDGSVSREHAEFVQAGGRWLVRDLGSTNGLKVNGSAVTERAIQPGDQ